MSLATTVNEISVALLLLRLWISIFFDFRVFPNCMSPHTQCLESWPNFFMLWIPMITLLSKETGMVLEQVGKTRWSVTRCYIVRTLEEILGRLASGYAGIPRILMPRSL